MTAPTSGMMSFLGAYLRAAAGRARPAACGLALAACATALPVQAHRSYGSACGTERWAVKTLVDVQARALPTVPVDTTVSALRRFTAPPDPDALARRKAPLETTLWRVRARLVGYRIERDSDYHLVLADPANGRTLIAEIPAPYCSRSPKAANFGIARQSVNRIGRHPASRRWWWLDYHGATPPLVTVVGYGFFDRLHDQAGHASNGAELHPVLVVR